MMHLRTRGSTALPETPFFGDGRQLCQGRIFICLNLCVFCFAGWISTPGGQWRTSQSTWQSPKKRTQWVVDNIPNGLSERGIKEMCSCDLSTSYNKYWWMKLACTSWNGQIFSQYIEALGKWKIILNFVELKRSILSGVISKDYE